MNSPVKFDPAIGVSDVYARTIRDFHDLIHLHATIKILVVVDGGISLTEERLGFGVGRVVRLLRESHIGCTHFSVDLARRDDSPPSTNNSPAPAEPRYNGFRFNLLEAGQPALNNYHEVWCFGFNPGNDAGPDANITQGTALPMSDAELTMLTTWMNDRRGGLLAMGDHDYLGASMCHRIPRIRSMRRWTNAQGVPPIGHVSHADTHLRHDTNQPATPAQISNGALIPFAVQRDAVPQKIDWVAWMSHRVSPFRIHARPHPILCHPTHGPIDVMPDHPHEGWCYEDNEIDLTAPLNVPSLAGNEYPSVGSIQPRPMVIAHGTTTPNPPYNLEKGPSPKKRFAMISVYDGHPANVGRVATDSTWHHWFDENIYDIEAAGGVHWDKISRYYLNVAKWLAPPGVSDWWFVFEVVRSHFTYIGFQEYSRGASVFDLGRTLHSHLTLHFGPCWVTQWVLDNLRVIDAKYWVWLNEKEFRHPGVPVPGGDPCLSCPPFELVELAVLGGIVRSSFPFSDQIKAHANKPNSKLKMEPESIAKQQLEGVAIGVKAFCDALVKSIKQMEPLLR